MDKIDAEGIGSLIQNLDAPSQAKINAREFIDDVLCDEWPEVGTTPDGDVCLEWENDIGSLTVLFDESRIYYSDSIFGTKIKGSCEWTGNAPEDIQYSLLALSFKIIF